MSKKKEKDQVRMNFVTDPDKSKDFSSQKVTFDNIEKLRLQQDAKPIVPKETVTSEKNKKKGKKGG